MEAQLNFTILSDGLANASQELRKFPNLPVINQGQRILDAINSLRTRVDQGFRDVNVSFILEYLRNNYVLIYLRFDSIALRLGSIALRLGSIALRLGSIALRHECKQS